MHVLTSTTFKMNPYLLFAPTDACGLGYHTLSLIGFSLSFLNPSIYPTKPEAALCMFINMVPSNRPEQTFMSEVALTENTRHVLTPYLLQVTCADRAEKEEHSDSADVVHGV